jgi:hypothetical protein
MKKYSAALITVCLLLGLSAMAAEKGTWTGTITDEKCSTGPKVADAACAKKCIEMGQKAVLVTDQKEVYVIHNVDKVRGHEGHMVKVMGTLDGKQLHVDELQMAAKGGEEEHQH